MVFLDFSSWKQFVEEEKSQLVKMILKYLSIF